MATVINLKVAIFVDQATHQWIVRDTDGKFWRLSAVDNAWENRQPFEFTNQTELVSVPGHYKYLLRLPI